MSMYIDMTWIDDMSDITDITDIEIHRSQKKPVRVLKSNGCETRSSGVIQW